MLFGLFDLVIDSEIDLLDLPPALSAAPALRIRQSRDPLSVPSGLAWRSVWRGGVGPRSRSTIAWSYAWVDHDLLLRVPRCGAFRLTDNLQTLICHPFRATTDQRLRELLQFNIIPRILGEQGHLVIHASCVSLTGGSSLVFMGASGAGKSTLAASFASGGHGVLASDDCVLLRNSSAGLTAFVTGGDARLWEDSLGRLVGAARESGATPRRRKKGRHRFESGPAHAASYPVAALFDLVVNRAPASELSVSAASGSRLLQVLLGRTLLLDQKQKTRRVPRFVQAAEIAAACPAFYTISYPRNFDALPVVRRTILDKVGHASVA